MSNLSQNISLKQRQELALKPKMLQSLKMLSLPILELEDYIKQELEQNPLLELREEKDDEEQDNLETASKESKESLDDSQNSDELGQTLNEARELTEILDQWNDYHLGYEGWQGGTEADQGESLIRYEENAREKFLQQLYPLSLPENEVEFASELIDSCNSYGFLPPNFDLGKVARAFGICPKRAEQVHQIILQLSPKGITARGISECLLAQLTDEQRDNRILVGLCSDQFENLIHRRYQKIASHFGVGEDYILTMKEIVAKLDPKPGLRILTPNAAYVYPDITIKRIDGKFEVIINDHVTPNIIISPRYRQMINRGYFDRDTLKFVRDRINSAKFLIKSIYMRTRTLQRVAQSIIKFQPDFFQLGNGLIHPLTYAVIARDLSVSESTISRVVKHKFAETPSGIYALKDFFSSTAGIDNNFEGISRQHVKTQISHMIDNENKKHPLSDQDIVELLRAEGLNISRRIVAKYRSELGILNSRLRRQ
ncbi:MAG: RNA polymerase sigma-54 factor [Candidatus Cloacimonetes bacterium ADurb.Bin117]|nr:MAG: RNA polymerase sigma-54 factor [Candidatus Cloacimonetes bacterium ADurb.Bin117]HOR03343.1 RNA polymerase factor sigma-54 [Candidatus Syntrophosphaera sp.]